MGIETLNGIQGNRRPLKSQVYGLTHTPYFIDEVTSIKNYFKSHLLIKVSWRKTPSALTLWLVKFVGSDHREHQD